MPPERDDRAPDGRPPEDARSAPERGRSGAGPEPHGSARVPPDPSRPDPAPSDPAPPPASERTEIDAGGGRRIGVDDWVAREGERRRRRSGPWGRVADGWLRIPELWRWAAALLLLALAPLVTGSAPFLELIGASNDDFIVRTGTRFLVFALLAVGLNVIVGWTGLLDLGYIAFYGVAGYLYAYLSSDFVTLFGEGGIHLPSPLSVPLIVLATALVGVLIGLVSWRLRGDYLAIVTLGFGLVFVQLALTATRIELPWRARPVDFTRGPNGINRLDDIVVGGVALESTTGYYYLLLVTLALVVAVLRNLNRSRIGRAWRAIREDELAAEVMGTPTGRMKLLAFAIGAGVAGLAGALDAAWQGNVVPMPRYGPLTLINLYAMVVLGGIGSLPGVIVGAFIFTTLPEVLRSPAVASLFFYGFALLGLAAALRPWRRFARIVGGALVGGLAFKLLALAAGPALWLTGGELPAGSVLNELVRGWLVLPAATRTVGNVAVIAALALLLLAILARERGRARLFEALLAIDLYLFAFAWETRLALEPSATRILIVGATLVVLMIVRPQGLFGRTEVRVV